MREVLMSTFSLASVPVRITYLIEMDFAICFLKHIFLNFQHRV